MVLGPDRTRIFISYSHRDREYLEELRAHLAYYEQQGSIDFWDDARIRPGLLWYNDIKKDIASARIAILLISPDYLASDFIAKNELPPLLIDAKDDGLVILSVILSPSAYDLTPLSRFPSINSFSGPLISMSKSRRKAIWEEAVVRVRDLFAPLMSSYSRSAESLPGTTLSARTNLFTYRGHAARVNTIRWSPDGKHIASASDDNTVQIWDAITGMHVTTYDGDTGFECAVAWSPDGKSIVVGGENRTVNIIDALTGDQRFAYKVEAQVVAAIDWSPSGKYLAFASANIWPYRSSEDIVEIIEASTMYDVFTYRTNPRATASLHWSPESSYLASAGYDGLVEILDIVNNTLSETYHGSSDQINAVMWSPDGKFLAAGGVDGAVQVWDTHAKEVISIYRGPCAVLTLAWAPNGQYIVSAGEDQTVQVWNVHTGETVQTYYGHSGMVFSVAWSPDGRRIASAGQDKTVQVWRVGFVAEEESKEQWQYSSSGNIRVGVGQLKEAERYYQKGQTIRKAAGKANNQDEPEANIYEGNYS